MDEVFKGVHGASLATEHGFHFKLGSFPGARRISSGSWQQLVEDFDLSWKEVTLAILEAYTMRTNGAYERVQSSAVLRRMAGPV